MPSDDSRQVRDGYISPAFARPDLCVRSPSWEASLTADIAFQGRHVRTIDEQLLAQRGSGESEADYAWLRRRTALDTRKAFVVFDAYVDSVQRPLLLRREGAATAGRGDRAGGHRRVS